MPARPLPYASDTSFAAGDLPRSGIDALTSTVRRDGPAATPRSRSRSGSRSGAERTGPAPRMRRDDLMSKWMILRKHQSTVSANHGGSDVAETRRLDRKSRRSSPLIPDRPPLLLSRTPLSLRTRPPPAIPAPSSSSRFSLSVPPISNPLLSLFLYPQRPPMLAPTHCPVVRSFLPRCSRVIFSRGRCSAE